MNPEETLGRTYDGTYDVPELQGIRGRVRLIGPIATRDLVIDDGKVTVTPEEGSRVDCTITGFDQGDLVQLLEGDLNLVTALLKGQVDADGDPMLVVRIAGSLGALRSRNPKELEERKSQRRPH